jgi:hypothetical protein
MRSAPVQAELARRARAIASAAGPGHRVETEVRRIAARSAVITDTLEARRAEAEDHTLTRAFGAGRG